MELSAELLVLPEHLGAQLLSAQPGTPSIRDLPDLAPRYRALFGDLARRHGIAIRAGTTIVARGSRLENAAHLAGPPPRFLSGPGSSSSPIAARAAARGSPR